MHRFTLSNYTLPKEAPSRVRLFKSGLNSTSKGWFFYDPSDKDSILKKQSLEDGRDLYPIDVAHLSLSDAPNPEAHRSFGWFELDLTEEGIFANNIQWSKAGLSFLEDRAFRYISPSFEVETDDEGNVQYYEGEDDEGNPIEYMKITKILNFALTNEPATYSPLALVASKEHVKVNPIDQKEKSKNMKLKYIDKLENNDEEMEEIQEVIESTIPDLEEEKDLHKLESAPKENAEDDDEEQKLEDFIEEEIDWKANSEALQSQLEAAREKILELNLVIEELKTALEEEEDALEVAEIEAILDELQIEDDEDREVYAGLGIERLRKLSNAKKGAKLKALSSAKPKAEPVSSLGPKASQALRLHKSEIKALVQKELRK